MGDKNPEDEAIVISNGEDIFVWRPAEESPLEKVFNDNHLVEKIRSFIQPISSSLNLFDTSIEGYIPEQEDSLWINPQGAAMYVPRGKVGKLNRKIPARVESEDKSFKTVLNFKYRLSRPGTANTIICSRKRDNRKASLVKNKVTLNLERDMIESTAEARDSLIPENF